MVPTATVRLRPIRSWPVRLPEYLYKQLSNFKSVDGKPPVRNNAIMGGMVAALSDEDMHSSRAVFRAAKDQAFRGQGGKLLGRRQVVCGAREIFRKGRAGLCRLPRPAGAGLPSQYPRLAGQYAEYTAAS
jgi:hypothetical protein